MPADQTREEHLAWCKKRALEYLDRGDVKNAVTSMMSDLEKHPETKGINRHIEIFGFMAIQNNSRVDARRFIEGFR